MMKDLLSRIKEASLIICLVLAAGVAVCPFEAWSGRLPESWILALGGPLAGGAPSPTETKDYKPGTLDVASMIRSVPGLDRIARISGEQVANIDSSHMTNELLLKLSRRVNELLPRDDVDGIVITHGTDTLEETAYFLNLTVKSDKPVVLTGSMRPATAVSADGPLNLYNAVVLASQSQSRGRGVLVTLNERIHPARDVTKTNTTSVETFRSPNFGSLGYVLDGRPYFHRATAKRHTTASEFDAAPLG
jgi:L-asparaginase